MGIDPKLTGEAKKQALQQHAQAIKDKIAAREKQPSSETKTDERARETDLTGATAKLPTAGEWVRSLLAKGFVPVRVRVIDPAQTGNKSARIEDGTRQQLDATRKAWDANSMKKWYQPHIVYPVLWLLSAVAVATYEVRTLPFNGVGWLFYYSGDGFAYPSSTGWLVVASVLAIILLATTGRLNGPNAFLPRLVLVVAIVVAAGVPIWALSGPKSRADCFLMYIKAGMSKEAVRTVEWSCKQKFP